MPDHPEKINPWRQKTSTVVYDNPWITVRHDEVITPGGRDGIYGKVHYKNIAVGIVPVDAEGYTWLVGQYRYTLDQYSWEIPEGGCPHGQDPVVAAQRELREETGITAGTWSHLLIMHLSNSVSDEIAHIYIATDLTMGVAHPEETEELTLQRKPLQEALDLVMSGQITDAVSVAALMKIAVTHRYR